MVLVDQPRGEFLQRIGPAVTDTLVNPGHSPPGAVPARGGEIPRQRFAPLAPQRIRIQPDLVGANCHGLMLFNMLHSQARLTRTRRAQFALSGCESSASVLPSMQNQSLKVSVKAFRVRLPGWKLMNHKPSIFTLA